MSNFNFHRYDWGARVRLIATDGVFSMDGEGGEVAHHSLTRDDLSIEYLVHN